jgi:FkbM family methyltransferase
MGILEGIKSNYSLFGSYGVLLTARARALRKQLEVRVAIDGIMHPINLRLRTTDTSLFASIIVNNEYDWNFVKPPRTIFDAGANIGLASIFYANKCPEAKIIAIEPEPANFEMLKKNTASYPNILAIQAALWGENKVVIVSDSNLGQWGFQTRELQDSDKTEKCVHVRGVTVRNLMEECGIHYIDVLKIDIEGSEKEVFENSAAWIDDVGMIAVELHDRFRSGCTIAVNSATKGFQVLARNGETIFFGRESARSGSRKANAASELTGILNVATKRKLPSRILSVE